MTGDQPLSLDLFFDAWELYAHPVLAGTLAGALLGWLGVYVVLRRMVFVSAALSQSASLGVALAFFAQIFWGLSPALASTTLGALALTTLSLWLVFSDRSAEGARRDSLLGLIYLTGAAGTLAIGQQISGSAVVHGVKDIKTILFGTAVVVTPDDFTIVAWLVGALMVVHVWWHQGFIQTLFDRDGARVRGLPVGLLEGAMMLSLVVAISELTRILGALPVFAFSVLPAMAAVRLSSNVARALVLAALIGAASGFGGYLLAFLGRLPVPAMQALTAGAFVVAAELVRRLRDLVRAGRQPRSSTSPRR